MLPVLQDLKIEAAIICSRNDCIQGYVCTYCGQVGWGTGTGTERGWEGKDGKEREGRGCGYGEGEDGMGGDRIGWRGRGCRAGMCGSAHRGNSVRARMYVWARAGIRRTTRRPHEVRAGYGCEYAAGTRYIVSGARGCGCGGVHEDAGNGDGNGDAVRIGRWDEGVCDVRWKRGGKGGGTRGGDGDRDVEMRWAGSCSERTCVVQDSKRTASPHTRGSSTPTRRAAAVGKRGVGTDGCGLDGGSASARDVGVQGVGEGMMGREEDGERTTESPLMILRAGSTK
ncbi:hypothetical protein B0H16DRAFT_460493 [Mycena metata]|uniref:Uncharacterized protein n=1 Tax=Mycena metata TaxID=1033252 RepID=A0AAD7HAS6_9AGAR|nr:hypothetical protein B0H16DRAFT_460493 [Mycena metata]